MNRIDCRKCLVSPTTCGRRLWWKNATGPGHSVFHGVKPSLATCGRAFSAEHVVATVASRAAMEDPWIDHFASDILLSNTSGRPAGLTGLNQSCEGALQSLRMPSLRQEEYRFTDLSPITRSRLYVAETPSEGALESIVSGTSLEKEAITIVISNGQIYSVDMSAAGPLPEGAYVGGVDDAPQDITKFSLGSQSKSRGGVFSTINGASARDCAVVYVPEGGVVTCPIHIVHVSSSDDVRGKLAYSAPRVLIFLEAGASAEIVEEFVSLGESKSQGATATFSVTEIELDDQASLSHIFVELEDQNAIHMKSTLVSQGTESTYGLTEVRLGGALSRHDVGIVQLGERTNTNMKHFILAGDGQTHDLHTTLALDYPEGVADQLHKCIVASDTAKGIFDGNVKVNRMAQRTDAGQLSRNLLLAPRATVNVKPNLQIVADDVKCTHGCAVSDLEAEQLFYLQARGIDPLSARKMLVYSFGGEVMQGLKDKNIISRVQTEATSTLNRVFIDS